MYTLVDTAGVFASAAPSHMTPLSLCLPAYSIGYDLAERMISRKNRARGALLAYTRVLWNFPICSLQRVLLSRCLWRFCTVSRGLACLDIV